MPKGNVHTYMTSLVGAVNIGAIWFAKREYVSIITTDVLAYSSGKILTLFYYQLPFVPRESPYSVSKLILDNHSLISTPNSQSGPNSLQNAYSLSPC